MRPTPARWPTTKTSARSCAGNRSHIPDDHELVARLAGRVGHIAHDRRGVSVGSVREGSAMGGSEQYTVDWADKAADLVNAARDDLPWYTQVAAELVRPGDRTAVDVGCGGGGMTVALATALGAPGRVLAVDATPQLLAAVQAEVAAQVPDGAEVDVVEADLDTGLAPVHAALGDGGADLVWASASVHHAGDQQEAVDAV